MDIVEAEASQHEAALEFYHSLIDEMQRQNMLVTWVKGVYPSAEFVRESTERGELYLGREDGRIAAAMVLNCSANEGYDGVQWEVPAADGEALVVHALGVHPHYVGRGFGAQMVEGAIRVAREAGMKAVRLDVRKGNEPARRIYLQYGFKPIAMVQLYYVNTGLTDFELLEYAL